MNKSKIIAHRGASKYAPENTIAAFKKAMELGSDGIELDVQLSSDGHIVVIHDEKLERTSNGSGLVKDKTLKELRELDFGSWFSPEFKGETIPTLTEIMELLQDWEGLLNIEIKSGPVIYPEIEEKVVSLVNKFSNKNRVIISSFNHYSLVKIKKIDPDIKTGILYVAGLYEPWTYAKKLDAYAIHPLFYNIVPEVVFGCLENGISINTYTVDDPYMIKRISEIGVQGIITNVPDVALNAIN
ncbi:MAG TPA: glycerophosphodiester phosphodiesterase [Clostridiaceae bacterium]|nr:glycerophosphodiester phosphodiesterase [Clostridiaceae bacterium]